MCSASESSTFLRDVRAKRHVGSSRAIHPYFGKVDPALSLAAISRFSKAGAYVLDPFCGSGTVLHDAIVQGRNALGWDSSPLAAMIATAKVLGITAEESAEIHSFVERHVPTAATLFSAVGGGKAHRSTPEVPRMPRIRAIGDWFNENALRELALLRQAIEDARDDLSPESFLLLRLSFSKIIVGASNQQGESTYRRVSKPDQPGRVLELFQKACASTVKAAKAFNQELLTSLGVGARAKRLSVEASAYRVAHSSVSATITVQDARSVDLTGQSSAADLVVTSPPYLMSWDYGLYHKFRFYWLGYDLDAYEDTEIGRHLRRKDDDVQRYEADMAASFESLHTATTPNASLVMVNAPSVVYGREVDTNALLAAIATNAGWRLVWNGDTLDIPGPHHGMYGSLSGRGAYAPGSAGKKEHVLVLQK